MVGLVRARSHRGGGRVRLDGPAVARSASGVRVSVWRVGVPCPRRSRTISII